MRRSSGEISIPLGERVFKLRARADRIERRADGRYVIIDYKTGSARTEKQVRTGLAPQLTLEAAMLRNGGFAADAGWRLGRRAGLCAAQGRRAVRASTAPSNSKTARPTAQADHALEKLTALVTRFEDENEPYRSLVHPMWKARYGDYDHLARVKEWSATGGPEDEIVIP